MRLARLAATLLVPLSLAAQQSGDRDRLVVSAEWLQQHLHDPSLVLLHVGPKDDYDREHIPGARPLLHRDVSVERDGLTLELPEPAELQATLRRVGISDDSRIVVYWGEDWVSPASRVVFTLDWAGLGEHTVLLDGGRAAWKRAGGPITADVPSVVAGNVTVHPRGDLVVDANWVGEHAGKPGYALVDARAAQFFNGERADRSKEGHIPGAASIPFPETVTQLPAFKPAADLQALFDRAGIDRGDTVVVYCHIGQYATGVAFAARTLGYPIKLYDGAFQDWAARNLPVTRNP